MLKRLSLILATAALALAAACTTMPGVSPGQQLLNTTTESCRANVAAIKAFNAAVMAGALKGDAARNGLKALEASQAACNTALVTFQAAAAASAASGAQP